MYRIPVYKVTLVRERSEPSEHKIISNPADAYHFLNGMIGDADREHFVMLFLDSRNTIRGVHTVSIGTLNSSLVHPREVFKPAMLANCAAVILCHNHPSSDPSPSQEDIALTNRLVEAGQLLGIPVMDHLILGDPGFISMKERGLIQEQSR